MSPPPPIDEDGPSWQCIFAALRRPGAIADEVTITTSDGCSVPHDTLLPAASVPADGAPADFTIVDIGVSAGGLAAFEEFLSGMPVDAEPRLLDPAAPRGRHLPIDRFFASLALDEREHAIAVVLRGTGSDGTAGARAVKAEGGMVMVQSAATAAYSGMPASALATGLVDDEVAPAAMTAKLMAYAAHADEPEADPGAAPSRQGAMARLLVLLHSHCGHDFSQYKPNTIQRRVQGRCMPHARLRVHPPCAK